MYGQGKTRGKVAILDMPAATNQACAVVEVGSSVAAEYLFHFLAFQYEKIRGLSNSGGQENLSGAIVKSIRINFPTEIREQQRIAEALNGVDHLIATLRKLVAKKMSIHEGMRHALLTGAVRLPGHTEPWSQRRLGDHVEYLKTVALSRAQLDATSPLRYLHYGDIHGLRTIELDAATKQMPRVSKLLAGSASTLQVGDLVFADASEDPAGVGKSVEISSVPIEGLVPGLHTIAARFDKRYFANGFKAYLQFNPAFRAALLRLAAGTKVLATTRSYISSISLALPCVEEQRAIASILRDADNEIEHLQERLVKTTAVKQAMMQELLSGQTRLPVEDCVA